VIETGEAVIVESEAGFLDTDFKIVVVIIGKQAFVPKNALVIDVFLDEHTGAADEVNFFNQIIFSLIDFVDASMDSPNVIPVKVAAGIPEDFSLILVRVSFFEELKAGGEIDFGGNEADRRIGVHGFNQVFQ